MRAPRCPLFVLDVALAFAVINRHFDVADLLLERGANINSHWNSHEPASILHHLVFLPNSLRVDEIPRRPRHRSDNQGLPLGQLPLAGWARHALRDETMAQWLEKAEREREQKTD